MGPSATDCHVAMHPMLRGRLHGCLGSAAASPHGFRDLGAVFPQCPGQQGSGQEWQPPEHLPRPRGGAGQWGRGRLQLLPPGFPPAGKWPPNHLATLASFSALSPSALGRCGGCVPPRAAANSAAWRLVSVWTRGVGGGVLVPPRPGGERSRSTRPPAGPYPGPGPIVGAPAPDPT